MSLVSLVGDFRKSLRSLWRAPVFTLTAVSTLALGVGLNTTFFAFTYALLVRPLPFVNIDDVVAIREEVVEFEQLTGERLPPAVNYLEHEAQLKSFANVAGFQLMSYHLTGVAESERLAGAWASHDFFDLLGVRPLQGRLLTSDDVATRARVAVVSYSLWRRQFSENPSIVGDSIQLNEELFTVVGVLPPSFAFPWEGLDCDIWTPISLYPAFERPNARWVPTYMLGRLREGVPITEASAELSVLRRRLFPEERDWRGRSIVLRSIATDLVHPIRHGLLILFASTSCILLIVWVNLSNLFIGRTVLRSSDLAIRSALGAGRRKLSQFLLADAMVIGIAGSGLGLLFTHWLIPALIAKSPLHIPLLNERIVGGAVIIYAFGATVLVAMASSVAPLFLSFRSLDAISRPVSVLENANRGVHTILASLVAVETTIAVVLVTGSAMLIGAFLKIVQVDLGFDPMHVTSFTIDPPSALRNNRDGSIAFHDDIRARVERLPGVAVVAWTSFLPPSQNYMTQRFRTVGSGAAETIEELPQSDSRSASSRFFQLLRIPVLRGRVFEDADRRRSSRAIVISETLARHHWSLDSAVGQELVLFEGRREVPAQIVGIVSDIRTNSLLGETHGVMYLDPEQSGFYSSARLLVRTEGLEADVIPLVKEAIRNVDGNQPFREVVTLQQHIASNSEYAEPLSYAFLMGSFGTLSLLLSCIGLYGVLNLSVTLRLRELGLRKALGARDSYILRSIIWRAIRIIVPGLLVGLFVSQTLSDVLITHLPFAIEAERLLTYSSVVGILLLTSLLAVVLPASRAVRLDPNTVLRRE